MKLHFDENEAARAIDRMLDDLRPYLDVDDFDGVQARLMIETRGLFLAYTREHNRGTPLDQIAEGVAAVCTNLLKTAARDDDLVAEELLGMILENLRQPDRTARKNVLGIRSMKVGNA
jgi:hypothetical protein